MAMDGSNEGADIGGERIGDVRFVNDIALLVEQETGLQKTLTGVAQISQKMDMKINIQKAVFGRGKQEVSPGGGRTGIGVNGELCISGRELQHTDLYLSIHEIYIALLQGNYSEVLPAPARAKIKVYL